MVAQAKYDAFPDEAHQDLLNRAYAADAQIMATTLSAQDAMMLINGLAMVAQQLGAAIPAAESTHADIYAKLAAETTRATAAEKATTDALTGLTARVAALEARTLVGTTGQLTKNLTLGVGGSTTTYDVVFAKAMPSSSYVPLVTLDSSSVSLLGSVSVVYPITNKTTTGCTVTVRNTAAVTLASSVTVQVAALQLA